MIEFRFHGRGGQGVVVLSKLVARLYFQLDRHVKEFPRFGVERRGAPVEGYVRVDDQRIDLACQIYHPDVVLVMAESILDQVDVTQGMSEGGLIIVNSGRPPQALAARLGGFRVATVDASAIALRHGLGAPLAPIANTTLFGAFAKIMGIDSPEVERAMRAELRKPDRNIRSGLVAYEVVGDPVLLAGPRVRREPPKPLFATLDDLPDLAHSLRDSRGNRTGAWRSQRPRYEFKAAPCNARCPAGNDVRGFLQALAAGDPRLALEILLETTPFPAVCGRVCPRPCEDECNRTELDEAVAVRAAERYTAAHGGEVRLERQPSNGRRVAVVGAGPAGLSAAWQLVRLGYHVVVHEAAPEPGGMLLLGIPGFRLPREVLRREIARIVELGVEIRCNSRVGADTSFETLRRDHDAVVVAVGQEGDRAMKIPGEELPGVSHGLAFLRKHNLGNPVRVGSKVVVVGGGNTAIDVAGVCLRESSTRDVTIVYRRSRSEMPAIPEETEQILSEGAILVELASPVAVQAGSDGRVAGLLCERMELKAADGSGRPRPVPIPDSLHLVTCDQVVFATGQVADLGFAGSPSIGEDGISTDQPFLFFCGDASTGEGTVAAAIGSGRRAALAIHVALEGEHPEKERTSWAPRSNEVVRAEKLNLSHVPALPRSEPHRLAVQERLSGYEEVLGGIADGCREASRCISCGTCTGCDNCYVFCPEPAVTRRDGVYTVDMDYCKGCGVCFEECPRGVIDMMAES